MNKIISFSLYGELDFYCLGLIENIDLINEKYNDWKIYVYYANIPEKILKILKNKQNTYLFECKHNGYNWEGMFWRFYPIESKDIDIFLSRDVDSRITEREMKFVNEWINSKKSFHIIRDNPAHGIEILAGTFGVKVKEFSKINNLKNIDYYKEIFYKRFNKNQDRQPDQVFLVEYIWTFIKDNHMAHIAFENLRFTKEDILTEFVPRFIGEPIQPKIKI
tara:strand:+ start:754 stop:1413 length:660 start_codon:yes stop_codon:yes gene_type:complete